MPSPLDLQASVHAARNVVHASNTQKSPNFSRLLLYFPFVLSLFCVACGAVGSSSPSSPATITVTPDSAQPFTGGNVQFRAQVQNAASFAVNWEVNQIAGGNATLGTISSTGYYVAPNSVPNPATVTVTAVSQADPGLAGSAKVTIQSLATIQGPLSLSPALASVTTSQALQLNVTTAGVLNSDVTWGASGGTITANGLFTPPAIAGPYQITATLIANPNAIGTATVEVTDFPGTLTWRNDNSRSGWNDKELALAPATVSSSTFGKLFSCPIDGYAYAQPLYVPNLVIPGKGVHNVVFVATEGDTIFAFDADASSCVQFWQTSVVPTGSQPIRAPDLLQVTSPEIGPLIGITGTPVVDLSASSLYVVAATQSGSANPNSYSYSQRLYALDPTTGQPETQTAGVTIGSPAGQNPGFSSTFQNQRSALLLDNGQVYVGFGSFDGLGEYRGWLFEYVAASLQPTGSPLDVTPGNGVHGGGIWQSGGGPSADSTHNVFVLTGDGPFDANRGGMDYSGSFLRLAATVGPSIADYFIPCDQAILQTGALGLGGSAALLLPDSAGSAAQPHLAVSGSKNGSLYVLNRDDLGKSSSCPDAPPRAQTVPVGDGPILSTPLFWNNALYVAAGNGKLKSFALVGGTLSSGPSAQSQETLGPQGATPVLSSNGTSNAILWLIDTSGAFATPNGPAILRAYDPSNQLNEIYSSAMNASRDKAGPAVKFTVPTVANGKVYIGTQTELDVYGLLQ